MPSAIPRDRPKRAAECWSTRVSTGASDRAARNMIDRIYIAMNFARQNQAGAGIIQLHGLADHDAHISGDRGVFRAEYSDTAMGQVDTGGLPN